MGDPDTAPDLDPFAQLASSKDYTSTPPATNPQRKDDPFAELASSKDYTQATQTSATGVFTRSAARGVLPALGSLPAMAAGAELGAAAGTPLAPFTGGLSIPALTIAGGLGGAFGGAALVGKMQDYALKALPDSWQDKLGVSDRQQQLDEGEHPVASFLGGIAPYALTMKPGISLAKAKLPENATALQRIMANPATKVLFGGGAMGGIQLAQEKVSDQGEGINWNRVAIATGFGMVFNRPARFGERITGPATELTQQIPWVARQQSRRAVQGLYSAAAREAASPTLNEAADAKVMGPGVTEPVFQGAHAQDPAAEMTAQQAVRDEQAVLGTQPAPSPDLNATARAAHPELFDQYDALVASRDTFRQWLNETADTESAAVATLHLHDLQGRIDAMAPEIQAAYRRAEEATGTPPGERPGAPERFPTFAAMLAAHGEERPPAATAGAETPAAAVIGRPSAEVGVGASEGAPGPQPVPSRSITEQRDFIAQDVARQLAAAGRPPAEANQAGKLWAHFFETAAKSFKGVLGSPEELYRREGAEIRGKGPEKAGPVTPPGALAPADQAKAQNLDVTKDVVSGANSSKDPNGPVVIDRRIPQFSPNVKDRDGNPANLWNLLQLHERVETEEMAKGKSYDEAHKIATAAERELAQRTGIDFDAYTKEIDGYLSHIEGEKVENPPADTHIDPQEAIGHHRSENKTVGSVPFMITRDMKQQLFDRGYTRKQVDELTPADAHRILGEQLQRPLHVSEILGAPSEVGADIPLAGAQEVRGEPGGGGAGSQGNTLGITYEEIKAGLIKAAFRTGIARNLTEDQLKEIENVAHNIEKGRGKVNVDKSERPPGEIRNLHDLLRYYASGGEALEGGGPLRQGRKYEDENRAAESVHVTARKRGGPAARDARTYSLLEFLADRGGIRSDDGNIADVRSSIGQNKFIPGFGQLIRNPAQLSTAARRSGRGAPMSLDAAREAAVHAGYLEDKGEQTSGLATSSTRDLLDAIDAEARGDKQYRIGYIPQNRPQEAAALNREGKKFIKTLRSEIEKHGGELTIPEEARALELWEREGLEDHGEIIERLALENDDRAIDGQHTNGQEPTRIPGWDDDAGRAPGESGVLPAVPEPGSAALSGTARAGGEGEREWAEFFQRRGQPRDLIGEREAEGQQQIPGADRISQAELVQRRANAPLKPTVPQKPADEGLFGDEGKQKELFQSQLGKITFREGMKPIMELAQSSDPSTFIHESGHLFLELMTKWAEHPQAPDALKADLRTTLDWLGVESSDAIKTRHHEKFARGFEQYLREGVAPSPELASVFSQFREWLLKIYQTIRGLGTEITPEIRGVFDRLLASEPQRTVIAPERAKSPTLADIHEGDAAHTEPHEAEPAGDRILKEAEAYASNIPRSVIDEHAASEAKQTAEATAAANEPGGQARPGAVAEGQIHAPGGGPEPQHGGSAGGAATGAELHGGGNAVPESTAKPAGGERPGEPSHADANLGDKPLAPRPRDLFGNESPHVDKAGNIKRTTLGSAEDVWNAVKASAERNNDFIGERQGVVTDGMVRELANKIGMDGAENIVRDWVVGKALNAPEIVALGKLVDGLGADAHAAWVRAKTTNSPEDILAQLEAEARHDLAQGAFSGAMAEVARATRALRLVKQMTGAKTFEEIRQGVKEITGKTLFQMRMKAALGASMDNPGKVAQFMRDSHNWNFWRMLLEYWINGLISGPVTHMTYGVGNEIMTLQKAGPETAVAAGIGTLRRAMGQEGDTVRIGEVWQKLQAHGRSLAPAAKAFFDGLRTGQTVMLPGETAAQNVLPFPGAPLAERAVYDEAAGFADVMASAYGVLRGIKDGMIAGGELAKAGGVKAPWLGVVPSLQGAVPDIYVAGYNFPIGPLSRLPSHMVAAVHSFYRGTNFSIEKAASAFRAATNEGLTGTAFDERVAEKSLRPTQAEMEQYGQASSETTLMGQGGAFTKALSRLTNHPFFARKDAKGNIVPGTGIPFLKFIDPFVTISSNIINQAIVERTPIGVLSPELRADLMGRNDAPGSHVVQDTAIARMLVGTAYAIGFGGLAAEGYISGSEPSDPHAAATWRNAGNQAHSVRIGDLWYDVHRLGPLGMLLGISADLHDVAHEATQGDMLLAASHLQHAITQNILDESFMRGPSDLIRAVEEPGRYGEGYIRNFLSSFVPYSVGQYQIARISDPYARQARTVMDAIKQKIPGLSESLLPRRDIWGEPIPNKPALAHITAIYEQPVSHDPVNLAMQRLGIPSTPVQRKIGHAQLTDEQYDEYSMTAGQFAKHQLDQLVRMPTFSQMPEAIQKDTMERTIRGAHAAAENIMKARHHDLAIASQKKPEK